ncbi:hypothetical protein L1987_71141 [Smallanthus sonchifolius]|uniref:Uncharacterized protein n=1 Tax=Smallanthus sonchifolius TaxID=185202 RepID=A0ACB9AQU4_9ASTR|nr:hypothetical protein L1987_71141 [Smallanthus sonchifolius]
MQNDPARRPVPTPLFDPIVPGGEGAPEGDGDKEHDSKETNTDEDDDTDLDVERIMAAINKKAETAWVPSKRLKIMARKKKTRGSPPESSSKKRKTTDTDKDYDPNEEQDPSARVFNLESTVVDLSSTNDEESGCRQDKPTARDDDTEDPYGTQGGGKHQIASTTPSVTSPGESTAQGESGDAGVREGYAKKFVELKPQKGRRDVEKDRTYPVSKRPLVKMVYKPVKSSEKASGKIRCEKSAFQLTAIRKQVPLDLQDYSCQLLKDNPIRSLKVLHCCLKLDLMPSVVSPQWQEKASGFFSSSGTKLKEAGQSAGSFVGEVAKDAKGNVSEVAERVGSVVKSRWSFFQQPSTRQAMQERLVSAAATTSYFLRRGVSETKEKVVVGKTKVEEVAKKTAQKSKTLLTDIERWQKGVASTDVFGVPIEVTVQRQEFGKPIPFLLVKCADYLVLSGLNSPDLFKSEGNKRAIQQLVSLYNQDLNAPLPEGVNPIDIAALVKCYLASLPQPLITFELHNEIRGARSSIPLMRNILKKLPTVNYMTLELVTALLLRVSQKSLLNKMDAGSLVMEMAPIIMWQKGQVPETYKQFWNQPSRTQPNTNADHVQNYNEWDMLADESEDMDASSAIPLDDGVTIDLSAIEVLRCLIEHHNAIFTDANETVWR